MVERSRVLLLVSLLLLELVSSALSDGGNQSEKNTVTYDGRSLIIGGKRELLFSGSVHYPRSTPDMWPDIIKKAKEGGLNVIQTYVFWNLHEPVQGQFNFEGNNDFIKFIKVIGEQNMYVTLRIGPFIEAEWNHGGFPFWLREVPKIVFRADNEPFKYHMKRYSEMIINKVKKEKLFFPQGGPIIMAQIENEYNNIQLAYKDVGDRYVQWAGNMALGLDAGVPWIMCKQKDAPGPIINTCNGRHCGDTFTGPNHPNKPSLWTENWTAQYRVFGDPPSQRAAEDIAYGVARFFSKNGTLTNYYMYYGGTNFGRTTSSFATTRYYDEAPLDEFGLYREPKFGHLRDLHAALKLCKKPLLWGNPALEMMGEGLEARIYEKPGTDVCAAFLTNTVAKIPATVNFRGKEFYLPPRSISILPDCKTVVYNTQTIVAQHNARNFKSSTTANKNRKWEMHQERVPTTKEVPPKVKDPVELYHLTKDTSDYAWYTTSIHVHNRDLPWRKDIEPVLRVASLGHGLLAFVNGEFVGTGHGSNVEKNFVLQKPINLKPGNNEIALLAVLVGLPDSGVYLEKKFAGPRAVSILGLNTGTLDLTKNGWGNTVGINGEKLSIFEEKASKRVKWSSVNSTGNVTGPPLTWYKTHFDAPEGTNPIALKLPGMAKGMVWINGNSIGRYWNSYNSPLGRPTQSEYHVPRAFFKPKDNLMVVFEETGGNPEGIEFHKVNRDTICSFISDNHPPSVKTWKRKNSQIQATVDVQLKAHLKCPDDKVVVAVEFASYGNPDGACGYYIAGNCTASNSMSVVQQHCMGKTDCEVPVDLFNMSNDGCQGMPKSLAIQLRCGRQKNLAED